MRKLLERSSQRIINILDVFVTQEGWITIGELSELVDAGVRTISNDVGIIKKRWGAELNIEVSTKWGIKLHNQNVATIGNVFKQIFNESIALKWLEEIFFFPGKRIEFYEDRLFVSRSTLIRTLPDLNKYLNTIGMEIKRINNQYNVIGNSEMHLRQLFSGFLLELHGLNLKKRELDVDLSLLKKILHQTLMKNLEPEETSFIFNNELFVVYYSMYYLVSLVRENQGFSDLRYNNSSSYADTVIEDDELGRLKVFFPNITSDSIQPISGFILSQYIGWDNIDEKWLVENETGLFYQRIFNGMRLLLNEEMHEKLEFMLRSLYLAQKFRPFSNSTLFDRIYYFSMTLKQYNFSLYQLFETNLNIFSKKTEMDMSGRIYDLLYWSSLILPEINHNRKPMRLLVISDFGVNHAHFIARYMENYFKNDVSDLTVDVGDYPEVLREGSFDHYHIIVTTISHLSIDHNNIVLINDYPTEANMFDLYRASHSVR
ncbi:hypothetical protein GH810_02210 [Acetobacterium paludosum]|uniref:Mga helix-turn-helix domain-containing protein n=1 Tax=Acetobacterium paludosum TaxID=52693 RepID=A0A923KRC8_9FIRM|nr:helix-turn-helix domain-containing protein [Acetobacterium paludosum]MBC3887122.1 hypothetical protein [Acetobacterium paludosum]